MGIRQIERALRDSPRHAALDREGSTRRSAAPGATARPRTASSSIRGQGRHLARAADGRTLGGGGPGRRGAAAPRRAPDVFDLADGIGLLMAPAWRAISRRPSWYAASRAATALSATSSPRRARRGPTRGTGARRACCPKSRHTRRLARSGRLGARRSRSRRSRTRGYSSACARCASAWPTSTRCRPSWCSATARCGRTWRRASPRTQGELLEVPGVGQRKLRPNMAQGLSRRDPRVARSR